MDSVSLQGNSFVFKDVLPGNYKLHLAELDSICVDDEKKSITVESTNLDVVFKQTGYKAELQSPIDAKLVSLLCLQTDFGHPVKLVILELETWE